MHILEFMYNIVSLVFIFDLLRTYYKLSNNIELLLLVGVDGFTRVKMFIEQVLSVAYLAYITYRLYILFRY